MKKSLKRILMFCIAILMGLSIATSAYTPVMATDDHSKNYITVSKNKSFNRDNGCFYMSFNLNNITKGSFFETDIAIEARVVNSSGKTVIKWNRFILKPGESTKRNFGYNYGPLPTGNYIFVLNATPVRSSYNSFNWKYNIRHTCTSSISFKSFEKIIDSKGIERQKFSIQCTNLKGKALTIKIIDSQGNLVFKNTGGARKTNNEVGWFTWSGYANVGQRYKCKSGKYIVEVYHSGGGKIIQNTYNLVI